MSSSDSDQGPSMPLKSPFKTPSGARTHDFSMYRTPSPTRPTRSDSSFRPNLRTRIPTTDGEYDFPGLSDAVHDGDLPPSSYTDGYIASNPEPIHRSEHLSAGNEFGTHVRSTPRTVDGVRRDVTAQTVKEQRKYLAKAQGAIPQTDSGYVNRVITLPQTKTFPEAIIQDWLETEAAALGLFDPEDYCWLVPQDTDEFGLYDFFVSAISAILEKFVVSPGNGFEREIVDIHDVKLSHSEGKHKTSPDLAVRATGFSFENPSVGTVGYANMATFIDVKIDKDINRTAHLEQVAGYVQQLFAYQPNRIFAKCMLMSEKRLRIVHFDRAGAEITPLINYVDQPALLVRLIIALCSTDERQLGFDTSIQWSIENGKKVSGTMKSYGPNQEEQTYELVHPRPLAQDYDIRGRATTFWKVRDPVTKEVLLVKQTWTSEGRPHEHLHLKRAEGIPGVCEIVAFEVLQETKQFRCAGTVFANRIGLRTFVRIYGKQIDQFESVLQALRAIRDAVAAHEELWKRKILHRDITNKNILLGRENAEKGWYGVLIDLGVALDFQDESNSNVTQEARSGSRFFQSCVILEHLTRVCVGEAPAHDYLDDLECFFYVLCFLFFFYHPDGTKRKGDDIAREIVKDWDSESAERALTPKALLLNPTRGQPRFATRIVTESWGPACGNLFRSFSEWLWSIHLEKAYLLNDYRDRLEQNPGTQQNQQQSRVSQDPTVRGAFAPLLLQSERHYAEVLAFLDIAIAAIELSPSQGAPPRAPPEKRTLFSAANSGSAKSGRRDSMAGPDRSHQK